MKKSELRNIIKEELIKEQPVLSLFAAVDDSLSNVAKQLDLVYNKTKNDKKWSRSIGILQQELHKFRMLVDKIDSELVN